MVQSAEKVVVLDLGTDTIKAGYEGEEAPAVSVKTNEGRGATVVSGGRVMNWDEMEKVLGETF